MEANNHMTGKILVVDDTPINIDLLEATLVPEGHDVACAESGPEAIEMVNQSPPDLILLDVMMPGMNGYEVCMHIRAHKNLPHIPIIFITASELEQQHVIEGLNAGGDDYIRKPFDPGELFSRIQANLRVKALYDELDRTKKELSIHVSQSTRKLVESIASGDLSLANRSEEVTVLFSDMRGFTQLSQSISPKDVFEKLNLNLGKQIEIIESYGGIVEKLSGDEVMAIFEGDAMADNALRCAGRIVKELSAFEQQQGTQWAKVGIGINTGEVFRGSLGTVSFKDFTVIGNTVNVAARLCGLAAKFHVLFTEKTLQLTDSVWFQYASIGEKMLKGLDRPTEVFKLTA